VLRVGLTGGIGSGKSEVARLLAARGAYVIDSDVLAREVVAPDGSLDRAALAAVVFGDAEARARLNAIVHPLVGAAAAKRYAAAPPGGVVVHDVPLLVETGMVPLFDVVVVVDAPDDLRVERLVRRGLTEADARARIAAQAGREERNAVADVVVENDGTLEDLRDRVADLWAFLTERP
jgi:dephospho-CoA kinase